MANVHRAYDINDDCYYVRVEGDKELHKFSGRSADKDSYTKMRVLIAEQQKINAASRLIDHANPT